MDNVSSWFTGLKGKLLLLAFLPAVILGVVSYIALRGVSELGASLEDAATVRAPKIRRIGEMDSARNGMFRWLWAAYVIDDKANSAKALEKARADLKTFDEAKKDYVALPKAEKARQTFEVIEQNWPKARELSLEVMAHLEKNDKAHAKEARDLMVDKLRPLLEPFAAAFTDLKALTDTQIKENVALSRERTESIRQLTLAVSAVGAAFMFLFGLTLAMRLASTLTRITNSIADSGTQVGAASTQLSASSQQLSAGATEAAASLEETVSSIEELSSMVKLNADHAKEAAALSQSGRKAAEEGEGEIKQLTSAMGEISQSSKRIEEIINVIDDIAFQTNILALNAAVEAARAGEQGKGFAVVAEAVRNLAQRSGNAAKQITTLIKDSVQRVEHGSKIADRSGAVLNGIVTSIKKVADLNNEIATASQEQSTGLAQISKAMNQLDQATQGNAASAEEAAASSEEMAAQAQALNGLTGELGEVVYGSNKAAKMSAQPTVAQRKHASAPKAGEHKPGGNIVSLGEHKKGANGGERAEKVIPFESENGNGKSIAGF